MPGQLVRNISEDGKSLRTATFSVGSEEVVHTKGTSAGRALEACRKVRGGLSAGHHVSSCKQC